MAEDKTTGLAATAGKPRTAPPAPPAPPAPKAPMPPAPSGEPAHEAAAQPEQAANPEEAGKEPQPQATDGQQEQDAPQPQDAPGQETQQAGPEQQQQQQQQQQAGGKGARKGKGAQKGKGQRGQQGQRKRPRQAQAEPPERDDIPVFDIDGSIVTSSDGNDGSDDAKVTQSRRPARKLDRKQQGKQQRGGKGDGAGQPTPAPEPEQLRDASEYAGDHRPEGGRASAQVERSEASAEQMDPSNARHGHVDYDDENVVIKVNHEQAAAKPRTTSIHLDVVRHESRPSKEEWQPWRVQKEAMWVGDLLEEDRLRKLHAERDERLAERARRREAWELQKEAEERELDETYGKRFTIGDIKGCIRHYDVYSPAKNTCLPARARNMATAMHDALREYVKEKTMFTNDDLAQIFGYMAVAAVENTATAKALYSEFSTDFEALNGLKHMRLRNPGAINEAMWTSYCCAWMTFAEELADSGDAEKAFFEALGFPATSVTAKGIGAEFGVALHAKHRLLDDVNVVYASTCASQQAAAQTTYVVKNVGVAGSCAVDADGDIAAGLDGDPSEQRKLKGVKLERAMQALEELRRTPKRRAIAEALDNRPPTVKLDYEVFDIVVPDEGEERVPYITVEHEPPRPEAPDGIDCELLRENAKARFENKSPEELEHPPVEEVQIKRPVMNIETYKFKGSKTANKAKKKKRNKKR